MDNLIVLLDIDNTLLDNDRFGDDMNVRLTALFGAEQNERFWTIYNKLRDELGYADYLGALQLFRLDLEDHPAMLEMSAFLLDYRFDTLLFPGALAAVDHLKTFALPVILSDGDIVFQPRKAERSGLWQALDKNVLIFRHKEKMLDVVQRRYPARHYAMVDDKPHLLAKMKRVMGEKLTTIFVRQGHYAAAAANDVIDPAPDLVIDTIAGLPDLNLARYANL